MEGRWRNYNVEFYVFLQCCTVCIIAKWDELKVNLLHSECTLFVIYGDYGTTSMNEGGGCKGWTKFALLCI